MTASTASKYGPMLANRRRGCAWCADWTEPCASCAAYIAGVRDALAGSNLVDCSQCGDVHDVRLHVAEGMAADDRVEATCDPVDGVRHAVVPWRCPGDCHRCTGCARCLAPAEPSD